MTRSGISRFVGSWVSASGHRLRISEAREDKAWVDFLDPKGEPVRRPYMGDAATLRMTATYDDYEWTFAVDLWPPDKAFTLFLDHEDSYELDHDYREALVPALSRREEYHFLDQFYPLFGTLQHFVRDESQVVIDGVG